MYNELVKMTGIDMYQLVVDIVGYDFEIELHDCLLTVKLLNFDYPKYNYTRQLLSGKLLPEDYEMPIQPQNKTYSWDIPQDYTGGIANCDMQKLIITLSTTKDNPLLNDIILLNKAKTYEEIKETYDAIYLSLKNRNFYYYSKYDDISSSITDVDSFDTYYNIEPDFKNYNPQHSQVVDTNDPSCFKYKKILEQAYHDANCKPYI